MWSGTRVRCCALIPPVYNGQIDLVRGMMDCLYAECKPCITDCVLAELEKLGQKYRVALKVAKVGFSELRLTAMRLIDMLSSFNVSFLGAWQQLVTLKSACY